MIIRFFVTVLILVLFACNSSQPNKSDSKETPSEIIAASLKGNETPKSLKKRMQELAPNLKSEDGLKVNREVAVEYIQQIKMLANRYPKDEKVPKLLSTAAELCRGINEINEALALYGQVHASYPKHPLAAPALFFQGLMLENELGKKEAAKSNYTDFLTRFPNHEFASIVKANLDAVDKSPEELIQQFKDQRN